MATRLVNNTTFLGEARSARSTGPARVHGPKLCTQWLRIIKIAQMFSPQHKQVQEIAQEIADSVNAILASINEKRLTLQLTKQNIFLNSELIPFEQSHHSRSVFLRETFGAIGLNTIMCVQGIRAGAIVAFIQEVTRVMDAKDQTLTQFEQPEFLASHKKEEEEEGVNTDLRMEILELYAGLLIKSAVYFHQVSRVKVPSAKHVKRLIQKITDRFDDHRGVFIGMIHLKLVKDTPFVHAVNTALYGMLIAHQLKLPRTDIVRVGMTSMTQDIHKLRGTFDEPEEIEVGKPSHFQTNMTSVTMLSEMGSRDVLSALRLVTGYERGFPQGLPLPKNWYDEELTPHLLSRIIELAKHYDMITRGVGTQAQESDMALQTIMNSMGSHYDPDLTRLFINIIGVYPVGAVVMLSTGERALVMKSPTLAPSQAVADRPTVKVLDDLGRVMDLSHVTHKDVSIVEVVEDLPSVEQPGALFLF